MSDVRITLSRTHCVAFTLCLLLFVVVGAASAQTPEQRPSVDSLLRALVRGEGGHAGGYDQIANEATFETLIGTRAQRPQATVDSIVSGLENLASTSEASEVREEAVNLLSRFGIRGPRIDQPLGGMVAMLLRLYDRQPSGSEVRSMIVGLIPEMAERNVALPKITYLAALPEFNSEFVAAPKVAVQSLTRMGRSGEAALQRLYETGALQGFSDDVGAYLRLREFAASRGWRDPVPAKHPQHPE